MTSNPRRPSYASVASGTATMNPTRMNTLAAFGHSNQSSTNIPSQQQPPREPRREPSRGSLRSMDVDGQGSGSGGWRTSRGGLDDGPGRMGCPLHEEHPPFFTPSYLSRSRHVERLERAHQEHIRDLKEHAAITQPASAQYPALSARSSNTNLSKLHTSHRMGVVQDVIERIPPPTEEDTSHPLPSRWSEDDRMPGLEIPGGESNEVRFGGLAKGEHEAASIRADHPMPREVGLYYYEVTVLSRGKEGWIGIGFSGKRVSLNRLPGWETDSWAYHGDDGYSFACTASGKAYGPRYAAHDVIGCGVNFRTGNAFFTKNGVYLGTAFSGIKGDKLYPSVGVRKPGEHLRANFGRQPFVFDIDRMMDEERRIIMSYIRATDAVSVLSPTQHANPSPPAPGETQLVHDLVGQYLAHEGYVETAKSLASEYHQHRKDMYPVTNVEMPDAAQDDVHAFNRQKIRRAILDGDIDRALKYCTSFYPHVLEEERNREVYFRLRCRKFVEMMRRYTEVSSADDDANGFGKNGEVDGKDDEEGDEEADGHADAPLDTQMELDDQLHREASAPISTAKVKAKARASLPQPVDVDVDMDASTNSLPIAEAHSHMGKGSAMHASSLLHSALAYGQELQREFGNDTRPGVKKTLSDIFAIMAYTNPAESVVGNLMGKGERVELAEGVNGAILVSLGKPPSAALEKLCADTEDLLEKTARSKTGGSASAFVNIRWDFLREDES